MQRYFSTFPGSWPGAGLLLLRAVVGGTAAIQGGLNLAYAEPAASTWVPGLLAIASGTAVIAGFMTPASCVVAGITTILGVAAGTPTIASELLIDRAGAVFVMADATALALLGPGAHSMDAYLFGRREIIFPHEPHVDRDQLDRNQLDRKW